MGFLGKLIGATIDVALTPVEIVKDVVTLGGTMTDKEEPYTKTRIEKAFDKVSNAAEVAADGDLL